MKDLHVHESLLGATVTTIRGEKRTIMACWLEKNKGMRPSFCTLVVDQNGGEMFKLTLPDPDWWVVR